MGDIERYETPGTRNRHSSRFRHLGVAGGHLGALVTVTAAIRARVVPAGALLVRLYRVQAVGDRLRRRWSGVGLSVCWLFRRCHIRKYGMGVTTKDKQGAFFPFRALLQQKSKIPHAGRGGIVFNSVRDPRGSSRCLRMTGSQNISGSKDQNSSNSHLSQQ